MWERFNQLSRSRVFGHAGPQPIGWNELKAWSEFINIKLKNWELELLLKLDDKYLTSWYEK